MCLSVLGGCLVVAAMASVVELPLFGVDEHVSIHSIQMRLFASLDVQTACFAHEAMFWFHFHVWTALVPV